MTIPLDPRRLFLATTAFFLLLVTSRWLHDPLNSWNWPGTVALQRALGETEITGIQGKRIMITAAQKSGLIDAEDVVAGTGYSLVDPNDQETTILLGMQRLPSPRVPRTALKQIDIMLGRTILAPNSSMGIELTKQLPTAPDVNAESGSSPPESITYRLDLSFEATEESGLFSSWLSRGNVTKQLVATISSRKNQDESKTLTKSAVLKNQWNILPTVQQLSDEESLVKNFLEKADYAEFFRTQGAENGLEIPKEEAVILRHFLSEVIKLRFAGNADESDGELSSTLRWHAWAYGSDFLGSLIQACMYLLFCAGLFIITLWSLFPTYKELQKWMDSLATLVDYLLPALGFLGTIAGLGAAFGTVGIVSEIELEQKISLLSVLLSLGTAFSTTYIGLLGCIILNPMTAILRKLDNLEGGFNDVDLTASPGKE